MKNYLNLLQDIRSNGTWKDPARAGMPKTQEVFGRMLKFNLSEGFPLLTTKKMFFKGIVAELLWFLRGDTNIKYLVDNGCNIWNADAYKLYVNIAKEVGTEPLPMDQWLEKVKVSNQDSEDSYPFIESAEFGNFAYGDCGAIYGIQWRAHQGILDQIGLVIDNIKSNPDSRYHIVTAWNPINFLIPECRLSAALPACHMMFQMSVRDGYLDLIMTQRSCDTFLGVGFNIASYALLTHIIAAECGLKPGVFTWVGNSVHVYENHLDAIDEQLSREPLPLCKVHFDVKEIEEYEISDFTLIGYESHPAIKAPLSVGV